MSLAPSSFSSTSSSSSSAVSGSSVRKEVLAVAVQLASVEGLEGMSIGNLAKATSRAKSSIISLFKSKEGLQLAMLDQVERQFVEAVVLPADGLRGPQRLARLLEGWVSCSAGEMFRGGCFLSSSLHEMDGRPGPVRDRVAAFAARWLKVVEDAAEPCLVGSDISAEDVGFRALGIGVALNIEVQMGHRERGMKNARRSITLLLQEMQSRDARPASSTSPVPMSPTVGVA